MASKYFSTIVKGLKISNIFCGRALIKTVLSPFET